MKHPFLNTLLFFLIPLLFLSSPLQAKKIELCEQAKLTWLVDMGGMSYEFVLTNLKWRADGGLGFAYTMTGYNTTNGDVVIAGPAMATARKQSNYFTGGELYLEEKTTVFVSHLVAKELKKGGTRMQPEQEEMYFGKVGKEKFEVEVDGEPCKLKGTVGKAENGNSFVIWKHKTYPMVLKMKLGWTISLKRIETGC